MNNIFLHDQWITEEIEFNENESTIYQSLWETANSVLRGKFLAMNAYIKNRKITNKLPNVAFQTSRKTRTREKIKIRAKTNELENKK
jgi:hypothetical protein